MKRVKVLNKFLIIITILISTNIYSQCAAPSVVPANYCHNAVASPLTATPSPGGTLNWYGTNATGGVASSTAPTPSTATVGTTTYYVSQTIGVCESSRAALIVYVTNNVPLDTPKLFCDGANATATSASFDFNNVKIATGPDKYQASFTYTYVVEGNPPVTGSFISPSHFDVPALPGQSVTFTITWNDVCTPSQTVTCYPKCVTPLTPTFNQVAPICQGESLSPLPTRSLNGVEGSWTPALDNTKTTTYTFTPKNSGECGTSTTMTIVVNPGILPTFAPVLPICAGQSIILPSVSQNGYSGTWSPAVDNTKTTTYTFTPTLGQCAQTITTTVKVVPLTAPIVSIEESCGSNKIQVTNPVGIDYEYSLDGQTYQSSPIFTNIPTGSHTVVAHNKSVNCTTNSKALTINLVANDVVVNLNPNPLKVCDEDNNGNVVFDLTQSINAITGGSPYSVSFYENMSDAQQGTFGISDPSNYNYSIATPHSVYVRVTSNFTSCYQIVELKLIINENPQVISSSYPVRVCENDNDGFANFSLNLPEIATSLLGNNQSPNDFVISFYETPQGANPLTNSGEIPVSKLNYQNITPFNQDIYVRVENISTGCVNYTGVLKLEVVEEIVTSGPQVFKDCDNYDDGADGVYLLDLTQFSNAILNGQNSPNIQVEFYKSQTDLLNEKPLTLLESQNYITKPFSDQIWVKVSYADNLNTLVCSSETTINIVIEPNPKPVIVSANGSNTICVDYKTNNINRELVLFSGITNPSNYNFEWYEDNQSTPIAGANGAGYTVKSAPTVMGNTRTYRVKVSSKNALGCSSMSAPFEVYVSGKATLPNGQKGYVVTKAFSENQKITILIEGYGSYVYSLDDGPRQESEVFENVSAGSHVIHVWDVKDGIAYSCDDLVIDNVNIIDYPRYFTPNGDGVHDTWNILGFNDQIEFEVNVFDKYGKLIKQFTTSEIGWDGTFNGHELPSTDYWFTVDYIENNQLKQFKSHFSLKR